MVIFNANYDEKGDMLKKSPLHFNNLSSARGQKNLQNTPREASFFKNGMRVCRQSRYDSSIMRKIKEIADIESWKAEREASQLYNCTIVHGIVSEESMLIIIIIY